MAANVGPLWAAHRDTTSAVHPRAKTSHIAEDSAAAASALTMTRAEPVRASGMARATYQAERQMNE